MQANKHQNLDIIRNKDTHRDGKTRLMAKKWNRVLTRNQRMSTAYTAKRTKTKMESVGVVRMETLQKRWTRSLKALRTTKLTKMWS